MSYLIRCYIVLSFLMSVFGLETPCITLLTTQIWQFFFTFFFFTLSSHYLFVGFSLALISLCDHYSCSVSVLNQNAFNHLI